MTPKQLETEATRLGYRLTKIKPRTGGRKPSCQCGVCEKCKNRAAVAAWRTKQKGEK